MWKLIAVISVSLFFIGCCHTQSNDVQGGIPNTTEYDWEITPQPENRFYPWN